MQSRRKARCGSTRPRPNSLVVTHCHISWYRRWLALDDHRLHLLDRWCDLQQQAEQKAGWFALPEAERTEIAETSGLSDLDTTLRLVHRRLRRWLRMVPTHPVNDIAVVTASLEVAKRLVPAEENPVVHGMITRAIRDLTQLKNSS